MLKLYIKDNTNGDVREYGMDHHDALYVQYDGSLQYVNLQNLEGTTRQLHAEPTYSFCKEDGSLPVEREEDFPPRAFVDIAGEYYNDPRAKEAQKELKKVLAEFWGKAEDREVNPDDLTIIS